jgi:hypothetical protein
MYDSADLAWAAGFFDGEGCFAWGATEVATASQTQLESLDIFWNIVALGTVKGPYKKSTAKMRRKPQWVFYAYGREARELHELLRPWLGRYRREQAARAFRAQNDAPLDVVFESRPWAERLAWASGFFDAEGCFSRTGEGPNARITHTDPELLERFREALGFGKIYGPYAPHPTSFGKKSTYVFTVSGLERVQALLAMLWPSLGSAKRTKAMGILKDHLSYWKCGHERGPTWKRHCPICFKPGPKPGFRRSKAAGPTPSGIVNAR